MELNGLEAPDELNINNVTQQPTQQNPEKLKPTCHHGKKPGHYRNQFDTGETKLSTEKWYFGRSTANKCLRGTDDRKDKIKSNRVMPKATQMGMLKLQPKL